jgi:hypothetical protein
VIAVGPSSPTTRLTARNLRDGTLAIRQPLRVVVDSSGRTPADARVRDGAAGTWIATTAEVGAGPDGRVDLPALLAALHRRGIRAVLLEGGPRLAGAFLAAGPGRQGRRPPGLAAARCRPTALLDARDRTTDAIDLEIVDVTQVGPDLRITARSRKREADMFTGIVEERARSSATETGVTGTGRRARSAVTSDARHGDSIAVNGACSPWWTAATASSPPT